MAVGSIRVLNLPRFDLEVKKMADETVPELVEERIERVAVYALNSLVNKTPVGDPSLWAPSSLPPPPGYQPGRARGGWRVLKNNDNRPIKRIDPSGSKTKTLGIAKIKQLGKIGAKFYIVNNTPYLGRLEEGYSSQAAPGGIIRLTLAEVQARNF
jgi:hypothetical protein